MDKERIFFLVSESRILTYDSEPNSEKIINAAKDAIRLGDRNLKIIEVEVAVGLPDSGAEDILVIQFKSESEIVMSTEMMDAFQDVKFERQKEVWDSMPEGIYRLRKRTDDEGKQLTVEFCPDVGDKNWEKIESTGWDYNRFKGK